MKRIRGYGFIVIILLLLTLNYQPPTVFAVPLGGQYGFGFDGTVGSYLKLFIGPIFEIAGLAVLFYTVFAAYKYMTSGGDKEAVASARNMITHSIIGIVLLIFVFLLLQYLPPAIGLNGFVIIGN